MEQDTNKDASDFEKSNVHSIHSGRGPEGQARVNEHNWKYLVDSISMDLSSLWRKERHLITTEINEKLTDLKGAVISMAIGGTLCLVGVIAAVFAAIYVLDVFVPLWLSAVIVTAVLFVVGGGMIAVAGKRIKAERLRPRHSIETLGEIKTSVKERVHEFRH